MPESEGEKWIPWGIHVTRSGDGKAKGSEMGDYTRKIGFNKLVVECLLSHRP